LLYRQTLKLCQKAGYAKLSRFKITFKCDY
jgi:hypothetical protein